MKIPRGLVLGWQHPAMLLLVLLAAFTLFRVTIPAASWVQALAPSVPPERWARLLGTYLFVVAGSHVVVHSVVAVLREWLIPKGLPGKGERHHYWPPILVGTCESVLFSTALVTQNPEFIAVWLGLKVAAGWSMWQADHTARIRFQIFLVGNAMSIGTAFVGARAILAVIR